MPDVRRANPIVPARKRMGCREARHAPACSKCEGTAGVGGRREAVIVRQVAVRLIRSTQEVDRFGYPFRRCRWQTPVARTSGRVVPMAKAVGTALRC
jgi:predicted alpha/beta-hydrolase family hydrolase